jgi:hypothetical protein
MHVAEIHWEQEGVAADFDPLEITTNYILLQIWDLFSLYICRNEYLKQESYEPVPTAYAEGPRVRMTLTPVARTRNSVAPYPFDQPSLHVNAVLRRLPRAVFDHAQDFQSSYMRASLDIASHFSIQVRTKERDFGRSNQDCYGCGHGRSGGRKPSYARAMRKTPISSKRWPTI